MWSLFIKEVNAFFSNLSAYLITSVFLISLGLIVWVFPGTSVLEYGYADLEPLFSYTPFVFIFLLPAITMRMVAEERKTGTWELLKTSPLNSSQIVIAKYFAALALLFFSLIPTLIYYFRCLILQYFSRCNAYRVIKNKIQITPNIGCAYVYKYIRCCFNPT